MRLTSFAFCSVFIIVLFSNYETISTENEFETDSFSDYLKRERLINLLKRRLVNDALEMDTRADDSEEDKKDSDEDRRKNRDDDDDDDDRNNNNKGGNTVSDGKYKSIGTGITIKTSAGDVNICDGKYIAIAATIHDRIRDLLISACSGASGLIEKNYYFFLLSK
jgi:hypothetical protein